MKIHYKWMGISEDDKIIDKNLSGGNGEIKAMFILEYPPYTYKNEEGEAVGGEIEVLYNFAREKGYTLNIQEVSSLDEQYNALKNKEINITSFTKTEKYEEEFSFPDILDVTILEYKPMIRFSNHPDSITNIQIYDSIEQFNGAPLGCIKDYAYENLYKEKFPESDITYKENNFDLLYALLMEEIEGFLTDENICKRFENKFPERITYYDMDIKDEYGFAFYKKDNNALLQEFNEFLAKQDLDALYKKWDVEDTSNVKVEKEVGNGDKLNVGIFFDTKPFCFIENEEQKGYELELLYKFAKEKNYQLNIINLEQVADRINYITNEKANITCGLITITEDRKNSVSFSNPIHETNTCLSVRTDGKKDKVNLTLYNNEYENIDDN